MQVISIRKIVARYIEYLNDKYVSMVSNVLILNGQLHEYYYQDIGHILLAYTVARLIYPDERWRIMENSDLLYLLGRDHIITDLRLHGGTIVHDAHTIGRVSIAQQPIVRTTHRISRYDIYDPESPIGSYIQQHPHMKDTIMGILRGAKYIHKELNAIGLYNAALTQIYWNIRIYRIYEVANTIFNEIPPLGCDIPRYRYPGDIDIIV